MEIYELKSKCIVYTEGDIDLVNICLMKNILNVKKLKMELARNILLKILKQFIGWYFLTIRNLVFKILEKRWTTHIYIKQNSIIIYDKK